MSTVSVRLKNRDGAYVTYNGIRTVTLDTVTEGETATFTLGVDEAISAPLDMASGDQVLTPPDNVFYNRVTIEKPETMIPENIALGINIAGIVGTFKGSTDTPQLHAVTIARSNDTVSISNPSSNGSYVSKYRIYNGSTVIKEQTTTSFSLIGLGAGNYVLSVAAAATGFEDSDNSSVIKVNVYTLTRTLENLTSSSTASLISSGLQWSTTLTPATGYYLPENIVVTMGGAPCTTYEWDSYTGVLNIPAVNGDIVVEAVAYAAAKLRRPVISIEGCSLTVVPPRFAETTKVFLDDKLEWTYTDVSTWETEEVSGATYGFTLGDDGYYESANKGVNSSYAMCLIRLNLDYARTIRVDCINYAYASSNFGILSKLDTMLALSTSTDSSTLYQKSFQSASSANVQSVYYDVPAGEHFICVKFKRTSSTVQGNDSLKFTVDLM